MESQSSRSPGNLAERWIALAICAAVPLGWAMAQLVPNRPAYAAASSPVWLPLVTAGVAAVGAVPFSGGPRWLRVQRAMLWTGLMLMIWAANGLPLDLLRIVPGLMPPGVDWAGLATRTLALAAAVMLAHLALAGPARLESGRRAPWYGYAAFVLALVYPFFRTVWVLGGTLGLMRPGAAGEGFTPWLACIPWLLAAALSVVLVSGWRWVPRRLLLAAGWSATAIVAMVGPAACWSLIATATGGRDSGLDGIAFWVPCIFYGSWFLWAIAGAAATRSYQLRSSGGGVRLPNGVVSATGYRRFPDCPRLRS